MAIVAKIAKATAAAGLLAILVGAGALLRQSSAAPVAHGVAAPVMVARPAVATPSACSKPAPASAKAYAALWASLDARQWGAADVSISVRTSHGIAWLYGDTLETGRFQHSTAIVQTGGCLHVSHAGAQLLPNDDAHHIYWIESARVVPGGLAVTARSIVLVGKGAWDFRDGGFARTALVTVSGGDLTFQRWTAKLVRPALPAGPMYSYGPHHFGYARHVHPEIRLADGHRLVTTCQNWDDGVMHPFADYRPIFSE